MYSSSSDQWQPRDQKARSASLTRAEEENAHHRAQLAGRPASGSVSRLRADAPGSELARSRAAATRSSLSSLSVVRELEASMAMMQVRDDRACLDRLREIQTVVCNSFQLDLVFLVDCTGSMQRSIDMVGGCSKKLQSQRTHVPLQQRLRAKIRSSPSL